MIVVRSLGVLVSKGEFILSARKQSIISLFAVVSICGLAGHLLAGQPTVADFPEIAEALKTAGATVPIADSATMIAFEENATFIFAKANTGEGKVHQLLFLKEAGALIEISTGSVKVQSTKTGGGPVSLSKKITNGKISATVTTGGQVHTITIPADNSEVSWIETKDAQGKTVMQRRPLADGILPHGPKGLKMMARWDKFYHDGKTAPWDSHVPAEDLVKIVENGKIKKGRTIVLGCGTGNNAIYLAQQGFEVVGLDVSPTGLGIAQQRAEKAGVKVRWMLADVLNPPQLKPFDFIFDRGCYHNVRYVDAKGFVNSVKELSRPGTQIHILSLNRKGPPGILEETIRGDWSKPFEFEWLKESKMHLGKGGRRTSGSWNALLIRK